ncbi:hypothetical protein L210DRAFT_870495 [Boletus edulis BED1]|uniref:Uncharacterized protein n=1 Tax=Boletus edulis BED1 TaxID=1328754 RepID=A0AAD4GG85_BOLED|nr:hypothetical protein L210DRAFT_870495 [Boletus edulis BED1]
MLSLIWQDFTENRKPVLSSFLKERGTFQGSTKATMYTIPTLLLHFWLASICCYTHFSIIEESLCDYYPVNGQLQSINIPFDLASNDTQLAWPNHMGEIVSRICATHFKHIVAVVTSHIDDNCGDFWLGNNDNGSEPGAAAVDEVSALHFA